MKTAIFTKTDVLTDVNMVSLSSTRFISASLSSIGAVMSKNWAHTRLASVRGVESYLSVVSTVILVLRVSRIVVKETESICDSVCHKYLARN